ncbi:MAG: hypothetical protein U1A77_21460 [Pirellulales bacterium]
MLRLVDTVDELGNVFQGRAAIEESLAEFFAENPSCTLKMNIDSLRFISSGVAVEDGNTSITEQLRELGAFTNANPQDAAARFLLGYHHMSCGHPKVASRDFQQVAKL